MIKDIYMIYTFYMIYMINHIYTKCSKNPNDQHCQSFGTVRYMMKSSFLHMI